MTTPISSKAVSACCEAEVKYRNDVVGGMASCGYQCSVCGLGCKIKFPSPLNPQGEESQSDFVNPDGTHIIPDDPKPDISQEKYPKLTKPCSYCQKHNLNADDGCGCWEENDSRREEVEKLLKKEMSNVLKMFLANGRMLSVTGSVFQDFLRTYISMALGVQSPYITSLQAKNAELVSKVKVAEEGQWELRRYRNLLESLPVSVLEKLMYRNVRPCYDGETRCCHFCMMSPDLGHTEDCPFEKIRVGTPLSVPPPQYE